MAAAVIASDRWKVRVRGSARVRSAKKPAPAWRIADAVDVEDAVDTAEIAKELAADVCAGAIRMVAGGGVEQGVDSLAGERPGDAKDDGGDDDSGDGIGGFETGEVIALAEPGGGEAEEDGERGPDIGAEVNGVGFEGERVGLAGGLAELSGAREVDGDRQQENEKRPRGEREGEALVGEEAADGLGDDPEGGAEHEGGFDEGGEALDFAVAVVMVFIGGAIGDADGEKGNDGGDEIDRGVCGLRQHAE